MSDTELPDSLYTLPDFVEDPELRLLYEVIVVNLQRDAAHVQMGTIQKLLIERIAYNYIVLRWREQQLHTQSTVGGFEHSKYAKDYNTFWLSMTQEFNRTVRGDADANAREEILSKVGQAIKDAFDGLHPDVADPMRQRVADALEAAGL